MSIPISELRLNSNSEEEEEEETEQQKDSIKESSSSRKRLINSKQKDNLIEEEGEKNDEEEKKEEEEEEKAKNPEDSKNPEEAKNPEDAKNQEEEKTKQNEKSPSEIEREKRELEAPIKLANDIIDEDSEYAYELIVGDEYQYKTIQSAVDVAKDKTKIKIAPGMYRENIIIKGKNKVVLCSLVEDDQAIILSDNSPCAFIYCLEEQDTVKLFNLKFIHRGIRDDLATQGDILTSDLYSWANQDNNQEAIFIFKNATEIEKLEVNFCLDPRIVEHIFEDNRGNFTAISVLKGTAVISNCSISLSFLTTETRDVLPAVYVENAIGIIENTLINGNKDFLTVGVFSHNAQLKLNECKIYKHRCGGVVAVVNERNAINITKCHILGNLGCGVSIMSLAGKAALMEKAQGKNALEINIEQNLFELNLGMGLLLCKCYNASVIGNKIYKNILCGAVLTDCDGFVMMNEFIKNKGCGLIVESDKEVNEAKIFKNIISQNYKHGIEVRGDNNSSVISENSIISKNLLNGIYVHSSSSPQIKNNNIFQNSHHGVLIESNSHAHVENNKIYSNVRTNLSFGGKLAENTKIIGNEIFKARNEGIYVVEAKGGEIRGNKVYENNEGIVLIKCDKIEVKENEIYNNARTGALLSDMSNPIFINNEFYENYFIGLLIRDASQGVIEDNIFRQNVIQFYLSKNCIKSKNEILQNNVIEGRYECADYCSIF